MIVWNTEYDKLPLENIKIVEERLSQEFPNDYVECVSKYQGGRPSLCNIKITENETIQFCCLLTFLAFDDLDILEVYNSIKRKIPSSLIPFGLGSDNYLFCFDYRFGAPPAIVVYKPNESLQLEPIYISDSFKNFINKLF